MIILIYANSTRYVINTKNSRSLIVRTDKFFFQFLFTAITKTKKAFWPSDCNKSLEWIVHYFGQINQLDVIQQIMHAFNDKIFSYSHDEWSGNTFLSRNSFMQITHIICLNAEQIVWDTRGYIWLTYNATIVKRVLAVFTLGTINLY